MYKRQWPEIEAVEKKLAATEKSKKAPAKGKANKAVIETLAKACRLPKSAFSLVSGDAGLGSLGVATVAAALSMALPDWLARERVLVE